MDTYVWGHSTPTFGLSIKMRQYFALNLYYFLNVHRLEYLTIFVTCNRL